MLQFIILAGGAGTKLWPLSRQSMPKQFLKLLDNDKSLFQNTIERVINLTKKLELTDGFKIITICNDSTKFLAKQQIEELSDEIDFIIVSEPVNRNTTAAIAISLELTNQKDDIIVLPSDQIWDNDEFNSCILKLIETNHDGISFIGIIPYYPATRFGYIKTKGNKFISFREKPNLESSQKYIADEEYDYLWNSGVLYFKRESMIEEINKNYNSIIPDVKNTLLNSEHNNNIISLNKNLFSNIESVSIDYGILEKYKKGFVIKYQNYWTDIDSFKSLYDYFQKDDKYNFLQSNDENNIVTVDTNNSFIYSENKLVTTLGVSDMIIVDTRDSLLVTNRNSAPNVSEIVKILKSRSRSEHLVNPICYKPWGWFINLEGSDYVGYKVKKICVYPENRLSLQNHKERAEHWVILKGKAKVQIGEDVHNLTVNQHVYIPKGVLHRLENVGEEDVEIIETQIGKYLGEDDITRYEDDFGR